METKIKHLEFIQLTINRMANNSFLLKGWTATLIGGFIALSFKEIDQRYLIISLVVLAVFWLLDGFYLSCERNFIRLYEYVRENKEGVDFFMDANDKFGKRWDWLKCTFSKTLFLFYGGLLLVVLIIKFFI